jgi:hypothetical protein
MAAHPEFHLPFRAKPVYGSPCNGCGLCCALELCTVAAFKHPADKPPCRYLVYQENRSVCALVKTEIENNMEPLLQKLLGIGNGCFMQDDCEL